MLAALAFGSTCVSPCWHPYVVVAASWVSEADAWRKWGEMAPLLDRMIERVGTEGEFPVSPGSALAGDDSAASPYHVSHIFRLCLSAGVDHLHALKVLIFDNQVVHLAAPASLARGALETLATAYWILGPPQQEERVTRALRWHAQNIKDSERATGPLNLPAHVPLDARLAKLDAVATRQGLKPSQVRAGYTSTQAVEFAEAQAPNLPLGVVLPWRLCSGFAHGRPWAYLGMSDRKIAGGDDAGVHDIRLTSNVSKALYPALAGMQLLERLLKLHLARAGTSLA